MECTRLLCGCVRFERPDRLERCAFHYAREQCLELMQRRQRALDYLAALEPQRGSRRTRTDRLERQLANARIADAERALLAWSERRKRVVRMCECARAGEHALLRRRQLGASIGVPRVCAGAPTRDEVWAVHSQQAEWSRAGVGWRLPDGRLFSGLRPEWCADALFDADGNYAFESALDVLSEVQDYATGATGVVMLA